MGTEFTVEDLSSFLQKVYENEVPEDQREQISGEQQAAYKQTVLELLMPGFEDLKRLVDERVNQARPKLSHVGLFCERCDIFEEPDVAGDGPTGKCYGCGCRNDAHETAIVCKA